MHHGRPVVTRRLVCIAESIKRDRMVVSVADTVEQCYGPLVRGF